MVQPLSYLLTLVALAFAAGLAFSAPGPLDPKGRVHIAIGIADTLDTLKTFVEAEGGFSPGFATYGISYWLYDRENERLYAATQTDVPCEHGLTSEGYLIPWTRWRAGGIEVRSELCQVERRCPGGSTEVVASRVLLRNSSEHALSIALFASLRPLGPAGGPVRQLAVSDRGDALLVDGHPALLSMTPNSAAGVSPRDDAGTAAASGTVPAAREATSPTGDCSGSLRIDLDLEPGEARTLEFVCPVLPGRRAARHHWDGTSEWAQFDLGEPNAASGGLPQPDPGIAFYRRQRVDVLFRSAARYWRDLVGRVRIDVPDKRWGEAYAAMLGHVAVAMNEGAPDVAVVNYNVYNRDGVYVTSMLQKGGRSDLAARAIDYFLAHPFNGRSYPEADNPGQVLWILGEHWFMTHDRAWLERVLPAAADLVDMIWYLRATPEPHYVALDGIEFGDAVPNDRRRLLEPGRCDGLHPEYTEAFDVAGLRAAAELMAAHGDADAARRTRTMAEELLARYTQRFGARLPAGYGSYCVLWPCRLYPLADGPGHDVFRRVGEQRPQSWRYFPLATAHQGLLAGNRLAGSGTVAAHLDHEQMRGWFAFDEGGPSGTGGWNHPRTMWKQGADGVAMPHGWAIAELHLLIRDCLAFEDGERLVLLAGAPPSWFTDPHGMVVRDMPTHFGPCLIRWSAKPDGAVLSLGAQCAPPGGFVLRLPPGLYRYATCDGRRVEVAEGGDCALAAGTRQVRLGR